MKLKQELKNEFKQIFGSNGKLRVFFAPGRVNLIGEHTDYVGGHVFPCALSFGTYAVVRKREDNIVRMYSKNFEDLNIIEFSLDDIKYESEHDWVNYPKGVIKEFQKQGYPLGGFDAYIYGNIPNGAGLSSSASVEILTGVILERLFKISIDRVELCKMAQNAENEFVGVNCGIMDQFAIGMGKKNHAILLDTKTLEFKYVPLKLNGISIIITNTNKRRGLADSKYNERRTETETALKSLQKELNISSLGELTLTKFEENKHLIEDEVIYRRSRHSVSENRRTLKAVKALLRNDIDLFGRLMNESHISLRDDYEVTGIELDTLVSLSRPLSIGVRMTGAGFGGCTVALVKNSNIDKYKETLKTEYKKIIGYEPTFYVASIGDGAKEIK